METTALVLFTRDLRVHDHPALHHAVRTAERVVPLFVLDDAVLRSHQAVPNRLAYLHDALRDLRAGLVDRGGSLVLRRGDVADEVADICRATGVTRVHLSYDVSAYARRRLARLRRRGIALGFDVEVHPGTTVVPPGEVTTTEGAAYRVFTPYWRRWTDHPIRDPLPAPDRITLPADLRRGRLPARDDLVGHAASPGLLRGGETAARRRLDAWFDGGIDDYHGRHDRLDADATSRLSADLHFGTVSAAEVAGRVDRRRSGHDAFARQLCWRDFNHQLLDAHPELPRQALHDRGDAWHHDDDAVAAWKEGRTGYPVIDAGMRQLRREGWIHNRVRMLVASFLTKHLHVDWRVGARHFLDWLVDGDLANNTAQWQWVAGVGTDTRPNRMLNPVAQSRRHDPDGHYIRRHVPELAPLAADAVHTPWQLGTARLAELGYPAPIVEHAGARRRFLAARSDGRPDRASGAADPPGGAGDAA